MYGHWFPKTDPIFELRFDCQVYRAVYVGNRRKGGYDSMYWRIPSYRHHNDADGCTVEFRDQDYLWLIWDPEPDSQRSLFYARAGMEAQHVGDFDTDGKTPADAIAIHMNPAARWRIEAEDLAWQAELERRRLAPKRAELKSFAGGVPKGGYFRCPDGYLGRVIGHGKKLVTWQPLDALPNGVEFVELAGPPGDPRLCPVHSFGWKDY